MEKCPPDGRILKSDTYIARNYLSEKEIRVPERNVTGYFDCIEDLIERENTFTMEQFVASANEFLRKQNARQLMLSDVFRGGPETIRTSGLPLRRRLLYPLSYEPGQ